MVRGDAPVVSYVDHEDSLNAYLQEAHWGHIHPPANHHQIHVGQVGGDLEKTHF